jgi:hypothetical protein
MTPYDDTRFNPSAPVAWLTLNNLDTQATWPDVPFLLDTGADVSLVPQVAVQRLDLEVAAGRVYEVTAFDGAPSYVPIARLGLLFCGHLFRGEFLLIDQEYGVLGRNVLNRVAIVLDGPHSNWREFGQG